MKRNFRKVLVFILALAVAVTVSAVAFSAFAVGEHSHVFNKSECDVTVTFSAGKYVVGATEKFSCSVEDCNATIDREVIGLTDEFNASVENADKYLNDKNTYDENSQVYKDLLKARKALTGIEKDSSENIRNKIDALEAQTKKFAKDSSAYRVYIVTFNLGNGSASVVKEYHYGDTVTVPDKPVKKPEGDYTFAFKGWDKEIEKTVESDATYLATYHRLVPIGEYLAPTCTTTGMTAGEKCVDCGETITPREKIPMSKHEYNDTVTDPTCTEQGFTLHTCKECGYQKKDTYVAQLGHKYKDEKVEPTCTTEGYMLHKCERCPYSYNTDIVKPLGHDLKEEITPVSCTADGFTTYTCQREGCDYVSTEDIVKATGHKVVKHDAVAPACMKEGNELYYSCENCDKFFSDEKATKEIKENSWIIKGLTHDYEAELKIPTCTEDGGLVFTCRRKGCDSSFIENRVPATGHKYEDVKTEATCEEPGFITHTCETCGYTYTSDEVKALGHDYTQIVVPPTCTTEGYTSNICKRCGYNYKDNYVTATNHDYVSETVAPTCEDAGYTVYTCSKCKESFKSNEKPATGHTFADDKWVVKREPTCTRAGVETKTCVVCKKDIEQEIKALGHDYGEWEVVEEPTCTENGKKESICTRCGDTLSGAVPATGHTYGEWAVTQEPTCNVKGIKVRTCEKCGAEETNSIAKSNKHSYKSVYEPATLTEDGSIDTFCTICGKVSEHRVINKVKTVKLTRTSYEYNGNAKKPSVKATDSAGLVLTKNEDYTVKYSSGRTKVGTYVVTVTFKGDYKGSKDLTFTVVPAKVTELKATAKSSTSIKLSWKKVSGATGYKIYKYNTSTKKYSAVTTVTDTSYTVKKLTSSTKYVYAVRAYAKVNGKTYWGAYSDNVTVATKPVTPSITVKAGTKSATVSYKAVSGASGYQIYVKQGSKGTYKKVATTKSTSYKVTGLKSGTTCYVKVRAYNSKISTKTYSAFSSEKSVKVK